MNKVVLGHDLNFKANELRLHAILPSVFEFQAADRCQDIDTNRLDPYLENDSRALKIVAAEVK